MRNLNDDEMDAVAGGHGTPVARAELPVKTKAKIKPGGVVHLEDEQELPGDGGGGDGGGGDGGGGDGGGGGGDGGGGGGDGGGGADDSGDSGDSGGGGTGDDDGGSGGGGGNDTGDTGGDDGHGNVIGDTSAPVDDAQNDIQLAKAEDNPKADIKMTCNTENGSKTCVSGNAEHFIVTTTDRNGNTTAYSCGLNPGYSVQFSLELFKSIRGGSIGGGWNQSPSFDCKTLPAPSKNG
jgi:hypothetical protein